jgi:tetratricopeptide (TPR) repeat protein
MRLTRVVAALIVALLCGVPAVADARPARAVPALRQAAAPPGTPSREWKRATSANFQVEGNASDDGLRGVLEQLESFRTAFLEMFPATDLAAPVPTTVVVFKDMGAFEKYQPRDAKGKRRENVGGYFLQAAERNFVVVPADTGGEDFARATVLHEFTHYIFHQAYPDVPTWLDEGLAEYYSTLKIEKGRTVIGIPPAYRLTTLRGRPLLPLERMLSTQETIKIFRNPNEVAQFYAQAWALVHYVTHGEKRKGQRALGTYLKALRGGASIEQAFRSAFNCSFDELLIELREYLRQFSLPTLIRNTPANEATASVVPQPMMEAEAEALQAELLLHAGALSDAETRLDALLKRDPSSPSGRLSMASLRLAQGRRDDALLLLRELVRENANHFGAQLTLATTLAESDNPAEALQAAEQATRLNARSPAAWWALALAELAASRPGDAAMGKLLALDPRPQYYEQRAHIAFRLGKDAPALRDAFAFVKHAGWGHESAPYMAFLAALSYRRLGESAEADPLLAHTRTVVIPGSWTENVLDFFQGKLPGDEFLRRAKTDGERTEAHTYIGFHEGFAGRRDEALSHFRWVRDRGDKTFFEYRLAIAELARLESRAEPRREPRSD